MIDKPGPGIGMKFPGAIRRQAINLSQESLVSISHLRSERDLPLLIQPSVDGVNLIEWVQTNRDVIQGHLLKYGGMLFRNFHIDVMTHFEPFIFALSGELLKYQDRATPRSQVSGNIYTSTDYPSDQTIELHNESAYANTWPSKIFFCCVMPAPQGGETPIADSRKIFERIDPQIKERFIEKSVMYVRNFGEGIGNTWQNTFQTTDRMELAAYCREANIQLEWKDENRLRTWQIRPAVAKHPRTGEMVWFNQTTAFHISTIDPTLREALLASLKQEDLPKNVYYGDGTPIEDSILEEIRAAYRKETVIFPWQAGDILVLDNMLVAHGRMPFVGSRKILTGMSEPCTWKDI